MPDPCDNPVPPACIPPISSAAEPRVLETFTRRYNTAAHQAERPVPQHPVNGDLNLPDKSGTYTKGVRQASEGKVDLDAFAKFFHATRTGHWGDFQHVPMGGPEKMNGPMGAYAYAFLGADASLFTVAAPPAVHDPWYATELIELYWCSLLRDVAFTDYAANPTARDAARELSKSPNYQGPTNHGGEVTPELLFRGIFPGERIGPYVSQFLLTPTNLGAMPFPQRYITYQAGIDYMTDLPSWFAVQQGMIPTETDQPDPLPRYLHNGRGLAAFTHVDELYQSYLTAYLAMKTLGVPPNPGCPYDHSGTQKPFGTFGGPDIAATLGQVAKYALNTVWYQKWFVHLRHRPEAGGGLVHLIRHGRHFDATPHHTIFDSHALAASHAKYGSYLLSQPFPEGSPTHPAYPTGHGAVGGACITLLKFFFDGHFVLDRPMMPSTDGTTLTPWTGQPGTGEHGTLTVNGELHKLAHNITFGHGLHGGIHWRSDSDASMRLGEAAALSFLDDLACTYREPFRITIAKLDGSTATIENH